METVKNDLNNDRDYIKNGVCAAGGYSRVEDEDEDDDEEGGE